MKKPDPVSLRFYSNENFPRRVVDALRALGHDVLTSLDANRANQRIPDEEVLSYACEQKRAVLTHNRRDFIALHRATTGQHEGIVVCTVDADPAALARRIHDMVTTCGSLHGQLIRVVKSATG